MSAFAGLNQEDLRRLGFEPDVQQMALGANYVPGLEPLSTQPVQMPAPGAPMFDFAPGQGMAMSAPAQAEADAFHAQKTAPKAKPNAQQSQAPQQPDLSRYDLGGQGQQAARPQMPGVGGGGELARLSAASTKADDRLRTANEKTLGLQQASIADRRKLLEESAALGEQKAAEVGAFQRRQAQEVRALEQEQAAEFQAEQDSLKRQAERAKQVASNYYRNEDGSLRVGELTVASLAVALGAFSQAFTGGPNAALQIVNDNINNAIDAERGLLKDMESQFSDKSAAREAARAAKLREHSQALESFLTEYTAPEEALRLKEMSAALQQEEAQAIANAAQAEHASTYQGLAFRQNNAVARANIAQTNAELAAKAGAAKDGAGVSVPGLDGQGISKEATKDAAEIKGTIDAMRATIGRLKELREANGAEMFSGPAANEMKQLATDLKLQYKEAMKLGAVSESDQEQLDNMIGDPTRIGHVIDELDGLEKQVGRTAAARLKALGFTESSWRKATEKSR